MTPHTTGFTVALAFATGCVLFSLLGFAWMGIHDWLDARKRRQRLQKRMYTITMPPPREARRRTDPAD